MGPALIDLYSTSYNETSKRKTTEIKNDRKDGNGNTGTIIKNKKNLNNKIEKKLPSLRNLLFDSSNDTKDYHSLSGYNSNGELLVNISEEEEKASAESENAKNDDKKRRSNSEFYKSSSDGCKVKQLISPNSIPTSSSSMQILNNETKSKQQSQVDFGKIIARFPVIYVGQKFLDKKYTFPMLKWLVAETRYTIRIFYTEISII